MKLYERTPVLSYCEGQVITCNTAQGIATAPVMVLATNAYTPQLGVLRNKVAPIRVSAIETSRYRRSNWRPWVGKSVKASLRRTTPWKVIA